MDVNAILLPSILLPLFVPQVRRWVGLIRLRIDGRVGLEIRYGPVKMRVFPLHLHLAKRLFVNSPVVSLENQDPVTVLVYILINLLGNGWSGLGMLGLQNLPLRWRQLLSGTLRGKAGDGRFVLEIGRASCRERV